MPSAPASYNRHQILQRLLSAEIIVQLHSWEDEEAIVEITDALVCAPALAVTIVFDHPEALAAVTAMRERAYGHMLVGMSDVASTNELLWAVDAGAQFVFSQEFDMGLWQQARRADILYVPGVFSQAEVAIAHAAGVLAQFLFPIDILGPEHVRSLHQRYPEVSFFTGSAIDEDALADYAAAGAATAVLELPVLQPGWRQADIITWVRTMLARWRSGLRRAGPQ